MDTNFIKEAVFKTVDFTFDGEIDFFDFDGVKVEYDGKCARIGAKKKNTYARGLFLLAMNISEGKNQISIEEKKHFDDLIFFLDCSRNGVMRVASVKKYIEIIASLGFDALMLYTEDTYEIEGRPRFGYLRGRYTKEEIQEIVAYGEKFDIEISSEFLVVASNLLYIKSKMILPNEDEEEVEDPRAELALRLAEYKKIKCAAADIAEKEFSGLYNFFKQRGYIEPIIIDESLKLVTTESLYNALNNVSEGIKLRKPVSIGNFVGIVGREVTSVFSVVKKFVMKLRSFKRIKFLDLFKGIRTREEAVASFLAVLEMVKMDRIDIEENENGYFISYRDRKKKRDEENV